MLEHQREACLDDETLGSGDELSARKMAWRISLALASDLTMLSSSSFNEATCGSCSRMKAE